jgi:hypothetical protein
MEEFDRVISEELEEGLLFVEKCDLIDIAKK